MLGRTNFKNREDWLRLLLCLPLFIHNFGTMLLLSGDDFRFFYLTVPLTPVIVFLLMHERCAAHQPAATTAAESSADVPFTKEDIA